MLGHRRLRIGEGGEKCAQSGGEAADALGKFQLALLLCNGEREPVRHDDQSAAIRCRRVHGEGLKINKVPVVEEGDEDEEVVLDMAGGEKNIFYLFSFLLSERAGLFGVVYKMLY